MSEREMSARKMSEREMSQQEMSGACQTIKLLYVVPGMDGGFELCVLLHKGFPSWGASNPKGGVDPEIKNCF